MIYNTIILGSGAAGLAAALRLEALGVDDILLLSEGLEEGTSYNSGSDKQTYYKLGMYGSDADSPELLAKTFFNGGSMHGDLALVESALSARCFFNLVNMGVPFPHDKFGQYVAYKTDHDPQQRASSCGPYTSKEMCKALIAELKMRQIPYKENFYAVSLLMDEKRCYGLIGLLDGKLQTILAENLIFAVGGPGALYQSSVYPKAHSGSIGLALEKGVMAQSLPESQFGLASTKFRWNVSGTYMQVLPRFISTNEDGSDEKEFLRDHFKNSAEMNHMIFLKGYQWPFDVRKAEKGKSSIIDLLVYKESVERKRRVFLDFRQNCLDFDFASLPEEAYEYLKKSQALFGTPLERLELMNPGAISLYADHGIDLTSETLEIAVCAQHNNGGIAGNIFYESLNKKHFFAIGEVNGSHGIYRPGGSALNAGQAGAFQAAEYIAAKYFQKTFTATDVKDLQEKALAKLSKNGKRDWRKDRSELQQRMTRCAAHLRNYEEICAEYEKACELFAAIDSEGYPVEDLKEGLCTRQLAFSSMIYLSAIKFQIESGAGSRGSALVLKNGQVVAENKEFRKKVLQSIKLEHQWVDVRPIPQSNAWFENVWREYREKKIYGN